MRDSTTVPQIVKIVRMVVKFHPLLTVTSLLYRVIFLQDWIEEEVSNQWEALYVYCQSTMRALLDPITEKMKNISEALQMHLHIEAAKGQLKAKLVGKLTMFSALFLLLDTELCSKYDKRGTKMSLLLFIGLDPLTRSELWSQFKIFRGRCSCTVNSTSNFTFFIIALLFSKFYNNSLRSLSAMMCISIFLLCVLVVLRPRTDLGLFSFIIGVIGSITYNRYELKFPMWIIGSICFVLFGFKSWLDKYWLDFEQDQSLTSTNTAMARSTSVFFILSTIAINTAAAIFAASAVKSSLPNYKSWLGQAMSTMFWNLRLHKFYLNLKDSTLPFTNTKRVNGLILTIVNVAQGMFAFALITSPVLNYKDWLFAIISYVVFCFWLQSLFPKDLSPTFTNTKGITSMILSLPSVAIYGIVVLAGLEPHLYYRDWLAVVTCYLLWWIRLYTSFPKDLLQLSTTVEFKSLEWWIVVALISMVSDVISWIKLSRTKHRQQQG